MRVLLLDDDRFTLDFVNSLLRDLGVAEVLIAHNGVAGLSVLAEQVSDIDLLICDIEMPEMDGIEFLRHIANRDYNGNIVLFSGIDADLLRAAERFARVSGLNVLGKLTKPVTLGALADMLERAMDPEHMPVHKARVRQFGDSRIITEDVGQALAEKAFKIYYQPKVKVSTLLVTGFESLVRWEHPQYGFVPPDEFIPIIEQVPGLMDEFTLLVLKTAVRQLSHWRQRGLDLKASVNISMENLNRPDLPEIFEQIVLAANVPVNKIILEVTELRFGRNFALCLDILTRLRIKGFGLSIDDFGTGYATMETLNNLPFTELKIDRMFVNSAINDNLARAILKTSIRLGRAFGLNVVAEGVETIEELELVTQMGCNEAQGYYFAKPVPHEVFVHLACVNGSL